MEPQQQIEVSLAWQPADYAAVTLETLPLQQPDTPADYTQLPENLPARIRQLARSITEDQSTIFEQVTAIENHLKNSIEFRYSKTDAVYPAEEQDYVDQFCLNQKLAIVIISDCDGGIITNARYSGALGQGFFARRCSN